MKRLILTILIINIIILLAGCGIKREVLNLSPPLINKCNDKLIDKDLLKRVAEYWHYRKSNMPEKSFEYEYRKLKGYKLDKVYRLYVKHMSKAKVKKIEVTAVRDWNENEKSICVDLRFYLEKKGLLGEKSFYQKDCWIKANNNWYHILTNKLFFKF